MDKKNYKQKVFRERVVNNAATMRLAALSLIYGTWLQLNPSILVRYSIYELLESIFDPNLISYAHVISAIGLLIGVVFGKREVKNFFSIAITVLWTTMAISAFISPPPNAIWIFCGFISILCYEAIWVD